MLNEVFIKFWADRVYRKKMSIDDVKPEYRAAVEDYISYNYPETFD